jgi:hypothetical protein
LRIIFQNLRLKERLYWHGSRNENWFNIMQTGLLIRPSGAVHTGSMFGDGIYLLIRLRNLLVIHLKWFTLDQG